MRFQPRPNENVLFPNPYVEEEKPEVIVTTQRVLYAGTGKTQELEASKITYSGKRNNPQFMKLMTILVILGLPFLIIGGLKVWHYKDLPKGPLEKKEGDKVQMCPGQGKDAKPTRCTKPLLDELENNNTQLFIGAGLVAFAAIFGGATYLLYKRRLTVVIGGGGKRLTIRVKDAMEQDKMLTMVGAAQMSSKAMAAGQAKVPPKK